MSTLIEKNDDAGWSIWRFAGSGHELKVQLNIQRREDYLQLSPAEANDLGYALLQAANNCTSMMLEELLKAKAKTNGK